jgi:hypothetical protein
VLPTARCVVQRGSRPSIRGIATRFVIIFLPRVSPAKNRNSDPRKSGTYGSKGVRYLFMHSGLPGMGTLWAFG